LALNRPAVSSGWRTVLMKERPGGLAYTMYSSNAAGRPEMLVNTGSDLYANGPSALAAGQWVHLAMTYDSTTLRVYVNGIEVSTASRAGTIAATTGALRIGGNTVWGEYFSGLIDDVRIYTTALSAAQIQTDMNTPVAPLGPPDTQPPTAPMGLTAIGGHGRVDLSWTASTDNVGVTGYDIHRSTTAGFVLSAATKVGQTTTATTYADAGLTPGTYYYRVVARDAVNNSSAPSDETSAVAGVDTTPPTVSVTAPAAGATVSGTVTLTATASDNVGVSSVQFRVDGVDGGSPDTTAPYSVSWNTTMFTNGSHAITAVATDAAGNVGTSTPVGMTVSQPRPPPPGNGLVAAWSFDAGTGTQALDSSPSANNGTLNGLMWTTAGRFGAALSFDGGDDQVDVPDSTSLDATRLTVEAWVRPSSSTGWRTVLLKERSGGLAYGLYSSNAQGRPEGDLYIGGSRFSAAPTALPFDTWTHLAMTYDGATIRTFVNGVQTSSTAQTGNPSVTTNALRIGGNSVWGEYFAGLIDEVRVYNRALSATEIQTDINTPVSGAPANPPTAALAGSPTAGFAALSTSTTASSRGAACTAPLGPSLRVIGASAEHTPAHHLMTGCCCGAGCALPRGGSAPTGQVTSTGSSAAFATDAFGDWSLPYARPPREILAV
jgi:Concanavalin A-like lectin/glucanases superfamily/Bacterial Ig domain